MSAKPEDYSLGTKVRALARFEPLGLMRAMGEHPWSGQEEIVRSVWANRETYVRTSHAIGKTFVEARVMVTWALAYWPDVLIVVLTPTEDQLTAGVWREMQGLWDRWSPMLPGTLGVRQWTVESSGVLAIGRSPRPERPGSLQGLHSPNLLLVVDEAPEIDPRLWRAARSLLTGENTRLLAAGNPTRTDGEFYRRCIEPRPGDKALQFSAFDTPNLQDAPQEVREGASQWPVAPVTREWLVTKTKDASVHPALIDARYVLGVLDEGLKGEWDSRVMAEFPTETDDTLIPRSWIARARTNICREDYPLEAGMDVARYGDDRSVLFPKRGPVVYEPLVWRKEDTMQSAGRVMAWAKGKNVHDVRIDSGAMGPGVIDRLLEQGMRVSDVNSAVRPDDPEVFHDRRSELWWALRSAFERGEVDLSRLAEQTFTTLADEVTAVRYGFTSAGKRRIEPKDETKKRLHRSPDLADALVYAFLPAKSTDWIVMSG